MAHNTSRSFCRSMKMILSGSIPYKLSAGGNSVRDELIHKLAPPLDINAERMPLINPLVAAVSSVTVQQNSWTAAVGNVWSGNE